MIRFLSVLVLVFAKLKVFMVFHSHNDAGWLYKAEDYYLHSTRHILNNVVDFLQSDPEFKFSWSESFYLSRYLDDYPERKTQIQQFIKEGKLEIVGGGWVQNDEALPDLDFVLRQMSLGFDFLKSELGVERVKTGWQIDPFGHSSLTAALWEKMGYESLVVARVDRKFKNHLETTGNFEFVWKGKGFGAKNGILTHVLNSHYTFPKIFQLYEGNYDTCYTSLPISDNEVDECVEDFEVYVKSSHHKYKSNNHLMLMGDDFSYSNYNFLYQMIDLVKKISKKSKNLEIIFSTPSEYFESVYNENIKFEEFHGDLLPLISREHSHIKSWIGYYSTMPLLKKKIVEVQYLSRAIEIIQSLMKEIPFKAKRLAITAHHDAITATSKSEVIEDYLNLLAQEKDEIMDLFGSSFESILNTTESYGSVALPCKVLFLFNPLGWAVQKILNFESNYEFVQIYTGEENLQSQTMMWNDTYRIYFKHKLQPFTLQVVFIVEYSSKCPECSESTKERFIPYINSNSLQITFNQGLISKIKHHNQIYLLDTRFIYYNSDSNGPYTFSPKDPQIIQDSLVKFELFSGNLVSFAISKFMFRGMLIVQRVLLEKQSDTFELRFELECPPGTEIFIRFSKIYSDKPWFYVFNSANIMKKVFRKDDYPIKGLNYYPINAALFTKLHQEFLYIIPEFPLLAGMSSIDSFELNLHRRPTEDDHLGIVEVPLNSFIVTHNWLIGFNKPDYSFIWKKYLEYKNSPIILFKTNNGVTQSIQDAKTFENWSKEAKVQILKGSDCSHLNSLGYRDGFYIPTLLNICEKPSEFIFKVNKKTLVGGFDFDSDRKVWRTSGVIEFAEYNNGKLVLDMSLNREFGMITSFDLVSFLSDLGEFSFEQLPRESFFGEELWIYLVALGIFCFFGFFYVWRAVGKKREKVI